MPEKALTNLLVKPAGADCNLRCAYCFYLDKCSLYPDSKNHRMSDEVLAAMIEQMMVLGGDNPSFGWQGGEPTLMGLDFFRRAVAYQQRFGHRGQGVGNGLQTNGLLIDKDWAEFLEQYQFLVGLSLDGPQHVHDHYRRNAGGAGSWERVVQTSRLLMGRGVAVNALVVVSDYSSQYPDDIYDFLRGEGYDFMQFIPIVERGGDGDGATPWSLSADRFARFFCRIFDRWVADFRDGWPSVSIRWFDSLMHTYVGLRAPECPMAETCGVYLCVEHTGDCYPCDFFVEKQWKLGNVLTDRLDHMLNGDKMTAFGQQKARLPSQCVNCHWYKHCFGGCTKDRVRDPRDQGLDHFCQGYKIFFEHADTTLKRLAQRWHNRQAVEAVRARREKKNARPDKRRRT